MASLFRSLRFVGLVLLLGWAAFAAVKSRQTETAKPADEAAPPPPIETAQPATPAPSGEPAPPAAQPPEAPRAPTVVREAAPATVIEVGPKAAGQGAVPIAPAPIPVIIGAPAPPPVLREVIVREAAPATMLPQTGPVLSGRAATTASAPVLSAAAPAAVIQVTPQSVINAATVPGATLSTARPVLSAPIGAPVLSAPQVTTQSPPTLAAPVAVPTPAPILAAAPVVAPSPAPPVPQPSPPLAVAAAANLAQPCPEPEVLTQPLDGGRMAIRFTSACRASEPVQLTYGGATFMRTIGSDGRFDTILDAFAGAQSPALLRLRDGTQRDIAITALDLDRVTKVALIWQAPVDLDLHAFEYGARRGEAGHVNAQRPSSLIEARELARAALRGRGTMSLAEDGNATGDKVEVYTFYHAEAQATGLVAFAVDYASRGPAPKGAFCGQGALGEVTFTLLNTDRKGVTVRERGTISAQPCGAALSDAVRFDQSALPPLRVRN